MVLCPPRTVSSMLSEGIRKLDFSEVDRPCCSLKEGLEDRFLVALESLPASSELSTLRLGFLICSE